jgi:hypothetical protein
VEQRVGLRADGALLWLDFNGGLQPAHTFCSETLEIVTCNENRFHELLLAD